MTFNSHDYVPWYMRPQQPEYKVFHDQDHIAIRFPFVASSMAAHFLSPELAKLGSLDKLPTELIVEVLKLVSIKDVVHFRQVNRKARRSVQTMLSYERVSLYGLQCVRTMLSTDIAQHYTFEDLYDVLCTPRCVACGKSGDFVYLPTLKRACLNCLLRSQYGGGLPFQRVSSARKAFFTVDKERFLDCADLNKKRREQLEKSLKYVHVTPGKRFISSDRGVDVSDDMSWSLVNWNDSVAALNNIPGEGSQHIQWIEELLRTVEVHRSLPVAVISEPLQLPGHKCAVAASSPMPYFNKTNGKVNRGLGCKGCALDRPQTPWMGRERRDTIYAEPDFLKHVQACPFAQGLWHRSARGTVSIEHELSAFCKMGGYQDRQ
jgi:hypothetical protein